MTDFGGVSDIEAILASLRQNVIVIVFIVDVSGSMRGPRIEAVNNALRGVLPYAVKKERESAVEMRIAVMEFSGSARWRTLAPEAASSFRYEDITDTGGGTNYSKAFKALGEKLSRSGFLSAAGKLCAPFVMMITDGKPSDPALCKEELASLNVNPWFVSASRAGIALAEGAEDPKCLKVLAEFTGNESMVFTIRDVQVLGRYVRGALAAGIDSALRRGTLADESQQQKERPPVPFYEFPVEATGNEIPGLEEIDWEREFLTS
ncbi:MAG: VWA domain-containing protein [Synergistaceae bacterium]|jgi:uncharacterized protein YegL|nr:VWA domain-containing protein [Synergistaceae bacterium]